MALQDIINQLNPTVDPRYAADPQLIDLQNTLLGRASSADAQAQNQRGQLESDYQGYVTNTNQQEQKSLQGLKDRYGWSGLINSGVYLKNQGDVGNQFQQMLQNAAQRRSRGLSDIDTQLTNYDNSLLDTLSQGVGEASGRYADQERQNQLLAAQQAYAQQMLQMQQQGIADQEALMRRLMSTGQYSPPPAAPQGGGGGGGVVNAIPPDQMVTEIYIPDPTGQGLPGAYYNPQTGQLRQVSPSELAVQNQQPVQAPSNYAPHGHGFYT